MIHKSGQYYKGNPKVSEELISVMVVIISQSVYSLGGTSGYIIIMMIMMVADNDWMI